MQKSQFSNNKNWWEHESEKIIESEQWTTWSARPWTSLWFKEKVS